MKAYLDTAKTPAGSLTFAVNEDGALIRSHFKESDNHPDIENELVSADGSPGGFHLKLKLLEHERRVTERAP